MPRNSKQLSILIASVFERRDELVRLLDRLVPQVVRYGDQVELLISSDDRKRSTAAKRQELVQQAKGEYVCFIDDDDLVPENYVEKILPHLDGKNDYVGFKLQLYLEGKPQKPTHHSIQFKEAYEDEDGYYRDISHLNPIKREIALQAKFRTYKEDDVWSRQIRKKGLVKTEAYIDEIMYHYYFDPRKSFWSQRGRTS